MVHCNENLFSIKINHLESQSKLQSFTVERDFFSAPNLLLIDERPFKMITTIKNNYFDNLY